MKPLVLVVALLGYATIYWGVQHLKGNDIGFLEGLTPPGAGGGPTAKAPSTTLPQQVSHGNARRTK